MCAIYGGADAIPQLRKFAGGIEIVVCLLVGDRPVELSWLVCGSKVPLVKVVWGFGWVENGGCCWWLVLGARVTEKAEAITFLF